MILCFSGLYVLHSEHSSDTKIERPPKQITSNLSDSKKGGKFAKPKK